MLLLFRSIWYFSRLYFSNAWMIVRPRYIIYNEQFAWWILHFISLLWYFKFSSRTLLPVVKWTSRFFLDTFAVGQVCTASSGMLALGEGAKSLLENIWIHFWCSGALPPPPFAFISRTPFSLLPPGPRPISRALSVSVVSANRIIAQPPGPWCRGEVRQGPITQLFLVWVSLKYLETPSIWKMLYTTQFYSNTQSKVLFSIRTIEKCCWNLLTSVTFLSLGSVTGVVERGGQVGYQP